MSKHTATLNFQQMYTDSVKDRARLQAKNRNLLTALEELLEAYQECLEFALEYGGATGSHLNDTGAAVSAKGGTE